MNRTAATHGPRYLAFELGVLRRLAFSSVAIPFAGRPELAWYLKLWRKRVFVNDAAQWAWWSGRALVENDAERLDEETIDVLAAVEAEGDGRLLEPWLAPEDSAWFSALRARIESLEPAARRALAVRAALGTLDYACDVPAASRARALGPVFADLARSELPPVDNGAQNLATNVDGEGFIGRTRADLLYVEFPGPGGVPGWRRSRTGLYETWVRGRADFWDELMTAHRGRFGAPFESKRAYVEAVDRFIRASAHYSTIAVHFAETGWISAQEIAERVAARRRVRVAYTRDFTAAAGGRRAHVIVAE